MPDAFSDFLDDPSGETFLRLRDEIMAAASYDFHSDALAELSELVDAGEYAAVPAKLSELMPGWLLSPRAHTLAGYAAEQDGDVDRARFERDFAQACLGGLRASGDGSRAKPYRVTHVADEYDLLEAFGKVLASQRQVTGDDGVFDLVTCDDGSEFWFDVTTSSAATR